MNLHEWGELMRKRVQRMNDNRNKDALVISLDLKALVQLRIQSTGKAYTGSVFSPYSEGYKKVRQKAGAQISKRTFTLKGEMWRNIRPEVIGGGATSVVVEIVARDTLNRKKLSAALVQPKSNPAGNILRPNERELQIVQEANKDRVLKYLTDA